MRQVCQLGLLGHLLFLATACIGGQEGEEGRPDTDLPAESPTSSDASGDGTSSATTGIPEDDLDETAASTPGSATDTTQDTALTDTAITDTAATDDTGSDVDGPDETPRVRGWLGELLTGLGLSLADR